MRSEPLLILLVIGSFLTLASLTGFVLRISVREAAAIGVIENLNTRIKAWWWIVLILGSAVFAGPAALIVLFALISFVALREFLTLTAIQAVDRPAVLASFLVLLPIQYALVALGRYDWFVGFLPPFGLLLVLILSALTGDARNYLARTAELVLGLMICVFGISHVPALLMLHITGYEDRQVLLMVFLILVAQVSDVMQYMWGKLAGRHKIAPEISPSKTVEGLIGGIASATALGAGLWWMTPFTVIQAGVMAFLIALAGFLGGLVMSAIKRDRRVKDWSQFIPGHGGMLDRVDSLCFSAPMFFYLARWFILSDLN
jgi:phosphatidate cytidylyltransferase